MQDPGDGEFKSALKDQRVQASKVLSGPTTKPSDVIKDKKAFVHHVGRVSLARF